MERNPLSTILGFGECMTEVSDKGISFAGDVVNCLKAAELSGAKVEFFTQVGNDANSSNMLSFLKEQNIGLTHISKARGFCGSYNIKTDNSGERTFTYKRKGSAASLISLNEIPENIFDQVSLFYLSGISLAISQSALETGLELCKKAKHKGIPIAYDSNYRANLWTIDEAKAATKMILPYLDILFYSEDDQVVLKDLELTKLREVISKRGKEGSLIYHDGVESLFKPTSVQAVDTSGAGDVFNGVYLAKRLEDIGVKDSQLKASEFACYHVTKNGAFPQRTIV